MLRTKMLKSEFNQAEYAKMATWCNNHQAKIVEYEFYYEVVDNHPTDEQIKAQKEQELKQQLNDINYNIAIMQGISVCGISIGNETEYDLVKDGELVTLNETEFNNYFDELTDKRSDIISQLKGVNDGNQHS